MKSKESDKGAVKCKCRHEMDRLLLEHNIRVAVAHQVFKNFTPRIIIASEKIDKKKRGKPPHILASFCPFCGVKVE